VTLVVLPYSWGYTLISTMLTDRPEPLYVILLVAALVAVAGLTQGLASAFSRPGWIAWGVGLTWVVVVVVMVVMRAGPLLPVPLVVLLFLGATLWMPWIAWMFYRPVSWRIRLGVLAVLLAALGGFLALLKAEDLTGDARVNFAWRWMEVPREFGGVTGGTADLIHTTDHDYDQFLGPRRQAVLPNVHLARDWNNHPPRQVWRQAVGAGWGAFAVVGDYAVTQEQRDAQECVVCYRLADGAIVWIHQDGEQLQGSMGGPGPRATPTIAGGRVYTVGGTGLLNCLDGATGRSLWAVNILTDNNAENISHGVCGSPLVVEDKVIVSPTGKNGLSLAAYHRDTGQRLWQGGQDQASYGSPMLAELAGVRQVLLYNAEGVASHDLTTGQVLWSFPWTNGERVNCSQPIPNAGGPDQVLVSTGYGKGCALFRVEHPKGSAWSTHPLWELPNKMKTKFTTAVLHEGAVYGLDDGILACVDLNKKKQLWKDGRYQHGQILLVGNLLLILAEDGRVVLVEPSRDGLRELGRFQALTGKTWNNPALAGRFLLVRNDHEAACYELPLENNQ
jgi:outer membrane protein assembly factor BamB